MAALSLTMPWFQKAYTPADGGNPTVVTMYTDYFESGGVTRLYDSAFQSDSMGSLMETLSLLIMVWVLYGVVYIASCVIGGNVIIRGGVLQILCVVPVVYFVAGVVNAVNSLEVHPLYSIDGFIGYIDSHPYDGSSRRWGPSTGFMVLLFASVLQFVVVTVRSAPIVARTLSDRPKKRGPVEDGSEEME